MWTGRCDWTGAGARGRRGRSRGLAFVPRAYVWVVFVLAAAVRRGTARQQQQRRGSSSANLAGRLRTNVRDPGTQAQHDSPSDTFSPLHLPTSTSTLTGPHDHDTARRLSPACRVFSPVAPLCPSHLRRRPPAQTTAEFSNPAPRLADSA